MMATSVNNTLPQEAHQRLNNGEYERAAHLFEQAIEQEPDVKSHVWYLGLSLLLQEQEAEAQTAWLLGLAEGEPDEVEQWTAELLQVLQTEADRRESMSDSAVAWAVRQHMREIAPADVNNLLKIVQLSIALGNLSDAELIESGLIDLLQSDEANVDPDLLLQTLKDLLNHAPLEPAVLTFTEACIKHAHQPVLFVDSILRTAIEVGHSHRVSKLASQYAELCLQLDAARAEVLRHLSAFYQNAEEYDKAIATTIECYNIAETLFDQVYANHLLAGRYMAASGYWAETSATLAQHRKLLRALIDEAPNNLDSVATCRLFSSTFFLPYFNDNPRTNRPIQNQVAQLCQKNIEVQAKDAIARLHWSTSPRSTSKTRKLRIGYLSHCLKQHSVGWISRWLFHHHDRERFQIHTYLINQNPVSDFAQQWFVSRSDHAYGFKVFDDSIFEQIHQDEIDILVDLDSITLDTICEIMAVKLAPIQLTWLGWDASGLPTVDYFIADPYVLPDYAQEYYSETIWRLPQTYVAVDGFEVGVPDLRRDQLGIPNDAITYLVVQRGYKRHPDNVRLQMRILKEVPNSYFLIRGIADEKSSKKFYEQIAEEEGVSSDRIRFLPWAANEMVHRANLGIADVVLDTYPYNGATTTLETLWMGIPMVTRVGEQFAARNSYTMMVNAGVTEGIAWTDEEYIEWGVRLGQDASLRQQVSWKLHQSRQTAPLWNTRQFTREMETAYEQMWAKHLEAQ